MARQTSRKRTKSSTASRGGLRSSLSSNQFYGDVIGIASGLLRSRQQQGAEKIASLAGAAQNVVDDLSDIPGVQSYAKAAATQLDYLSDYVAHTNLETMVDDAVRFARAYPLSTVTFAVAAGYGLTRLLTVNSRARFAARPNGTRKPVVAKRASGKRKSGAQSNSRIKSASPAKSKLSGKTAANGKLNGNGAAHAS